VKEFAPPNRFLGVFGPALASGGDVSGVLLTAGGTSTFGPSFSIFLGDILSVEALAERQKTASKQTSFCLPNTVRVCW
jgi:hypothetical protein